MLENKNKKLTTKSEPTMSHLLLFHVTTAGQNGENLGSDEAQIIQLSYMLYDVGANKVDFE